MTYRDDLAALEARHQALEQDVAHKTQELERAARLLDEARARTKLPVLPNIRVASPCTADWNAMTGDERTRACAQCNKNVYNLSEMTREEAEALIIEKEGKLCARYYQRSDGTILLKDCSIGVARQRRRRAIAWGAVGLLAGGGVAGYQLMHRATATLGAVTFTDEPQRTEYRVVQGVEAPPDELEVHVKHGKPSKKEIEESQVMQGDISE